MLRIRISTVSGQIRHILNSRDNDRKFQNLSGQKLYGYVDGVLTNIRNEGWKECKLLRYEDQQSQNISHRGLLGPISSFGRMARRGAINIGASKVEELVFLIDGAKGFHNHICKNLPKNFDTPAFPYRKFHPCLFIKIYVQLPTLEKLPEMVP
jgi:hypothetical protein